MSLKVFLGQSHPIFLCQFTGKDGHQETVQSRAQDHQYALRAFCLSNQNRGGIEETNFQLSSKKDDPITLQYTSEWGDVLIIHNLTLARKMDIQEENLVSKINSDNYQNRPYQRLVEEV